MALVASTWIFTEQGPRQVKDLIGNKVNLMVNGEIYPTTNAGFFMEGEIATFLLITKEGYFIEATGDQKLLHKPCRSKEIQKRELSNLLPKDIIFLQNHKNIVWTKKYKLSTEMKTMLDYSIPFDEKVFVDMSDKIETLSHSFYKKFFKNLFYEQMTGFNNSFELKGSQIFLESIQRMLLRVGIVSQIRTDINKLVFSGIDVTKFYSLTKYKPRVISHQSWEFHLFSQTMDRTPSFDDYAVQVEQIKPRGKTNIYSCIVPEINQFDANGFISICNV